MSIADQPDTTAVTDDLNGAAGHIERHGWAQGDYFGPDDQSACALGGIAIATKWATDGSRWDADTLAEEPATQALLEYLTETRPDELVVKYRGEIDADDDPLNPIGEREVDVVRTIGTWNDAPERTAEQVIETLRSAARWAGEQ